MNDVYESTALTPIRVARLSGFIDWSSQPSMFKHYPEFLFRYPFNTNSALKVVELSRCITSRSKVGVKPYYQLNTPSAGNLHPIELYVQIRGVKGVLSGIYHVDLSSDSIVLIKEIENDGIESAVGLENRFNGMIFVVSSVPFRSEWKYGDRAIRYCYLDAGHQIGALQTALTIDEQRATILLLPDADELNMLMGFRDDEFTCSAIAVGEQTQKSVEKLKSPLMYVAPTDYNETKGYIPSLISKQEASSTLLHVDYKIDEELLKSRRSARKFGGGKIDEESYEYFIDMSNSISDGLFCKIVTLEDEKVQEKISSILVNQSFVKGASFVAVITSESFGASELMSAGVFAHQLHLYAHSRDIGFSGIGAFYDKKLQDYLDTQKYILYVCAIGTNKE